MYTFRMDTSANTMDIADFVDIVWSTAAPLRVYVYKGDTYAGMITVTGGATFILKLAQRLPRKEELLRETISLQAGHAEIGFALGMLLARNIS